MRFTYVETADRRPGRARGTRRGTLHHLLTVVLIALAGLAAWEIVTFAIDYAKALHG